MAKIKKMDKARATMIYLDESRARNGKARCPGVGDLDGGVDTRGGGRAAQAQAEKGGAAMRERGSGSVFRKAGDAVLVDRVHFGATLPGKLGIDRPKGRAEIASREASQGHQAPFRRPCDGAALDARRYAGAIAIRLRAQGQQQLSYRQERLQDHLQKEFEFHRVSDITGEEIADYADRRAKPRARAERVRRVGR